MARSSAATSLTDIIESIETIRGEMQGVTIIAFERDKVRRWVVERGIEIIPEASRRLPAALKARHTGIPWPKVAAIGNILRHEYQDVAHDILWHVVMEDLPELE